MGVFAQISDVANRYVEGTLPSNLTVEDGWVDLRIKDVENELMGLVPSLDGANPDQLEPSRLGRVVALVSDKVLDLYRNPQRAKQLTQAMGDMNIGSTLSNGFDAMIDFTDEELNRVRIRTQRARFGTAILTPWKVSTKEARPWPGF
jgi:hypothetical protein